MDWKNRGNRQGQPAQPTTPAQGLGGAHVPTNNTTSAQSTKGDVKGMRIATTALLFSGTILVVLLLIFLAVGGKAGGESKFVKEDKLQAVFLNGGQVYFGKITNLNNQYMRLANIYYLRVNQQVQPDANAAQSQNDISLVKLGCELHGPEDSMVINREQVIFWENLKDEGQVAEAVAAYIQQNPNGQDCETDQSSNTGSPGAGATAPVGSDPAGQSDAPFGEPNPLGQDDAN